MPSNLKNIENNPKYKDHILYEDLYDSWSEDVDWILSHVNWALTDPQDYFRGFVDDEKLKQLEGAAIELFLPENVAIMDLWGHHLQDHSAIFKAFVELGQ